MKKRILIVAYWLAAIALTATLLTSLDYDLGHAVAMSLSFLPAAMALSYFLPKVDRTRGRKDQVLDTIFIILGVMTMTFFFIYLIQLLFLLVIDQVQSGWDLPSMLWNPVFVAVVLAILAYGHYLLVKWLDKKFPSERPVTFNSGYKKVSLRKEDILYIESRDAEVWIYARDGRQYRNRTGISQWEDVLGPGFVRIHRAFLVNRAEMKVLSSESVSVAGKELPVSRKNKDSVQQIYE
ncbi:MAG: LytTR family transcriptional regulator [Bacteroidales bacterium]|nr:LytTR family transcriptional regulator [Bacteroidales bacterium]